jgi:hypothetical protein
MSQHDYIIDNQLAPAFRSDLNAALNAIVSTNSGITAPTTAYANMLWYDTTNDLLKMRNESNSAFITLGTIDQTNSVFNPNFLPATQAEAEAGTNNVKGVTPLRVAQAIAALTTSFSSGVNIQVITATGTYTPTSGYNWGIAFLTNGGQGGQAGAGSGASGHGGNAGSTRIGLVDVTAPRAVTIGAGGVSSLGAGGTSSLAGFTALMTNSGSTFVDGPSIVVETGTPSFWGDSYGSGGNGYQGNGSTGSGNGQAGTAGVLLVMEFK